MGKRIDKDKFDKVIGNYNNSIEQIKRVYSGSEQDSFFAIMTDGFRPEKVGDAIDIFKNTNIDNDVKLREVVECIIKGAINRGDEKQPIDTHIYRALRGKSAIKQEWLTDICDFLKCEEKDIIESTDYCNTPIAFDSEKEFSINKKYLLSDEIEFSLKCKGKEHTYEEVMELYYNISALIREFEQDNNDFEASTNVAETSFGENSFKQFHENRYISSNESKKEFKEA